MKEKEKKHNHKVLNFFGKAILSIFKGIFKLTNFILRKIFRIIGRIKNFIISHFSTIVLTLSIITTALLGISAKLNIYLFKKIMEGKSNVTNNNYTEDKDKEIETEQPDISYDLVERIFGVIIEKELPPQLDENVEQEKRSIATEIKDFRMNIYNPFKEKVNMSIDEKINWLFYAIDSNKTLSSELKEILKKLEIFYRDTADFFPWELAYYNILTYISTPSSIPGVYCEGYFDGITDKSYNIYNNFDKRNFPYSTEYPNNLYTEAFHILTFKPEKHSIGFYDYENKVGLGMNDGIIQTLYEEYIKGIAYGTGHDFADETDITKMIRQFFNRKLILDAFLNGSIDDIINSFVDNIGDRGIATSIINQLDQCSKFSYMGLSDLKEKKALAELTARTIRTYHDIIYSGDCYSKLIMNGLYLQLTKDNYTDFMMYKVFYNTNLSNEIVIETKNDLLPYLNLDETPVYISSDGKSTTISLPNEIFKDKALYK